MPYLEGPGVDWLLDSLGWTRRRVTAARARSRTSAGSVLAWRSISGMVPEQVTRCSPFRARVTPWVTRARNGERGRFI